MTTQTTNTILWATIIVDESSLTDACGNGDPVDAGASIEQYCEMVAAEATKLAGREVGCITRVTLYDAIEYQRTVNERGDYTQGHTYINDLVDDMGESLTDDPELVNIADAARIATASVFEDGDFYVTLD